MPREQEEKEEAGVKSTFSTEDASLQITDAGHPFPTHGEIVKAGYVSISRRARLIISRPRVRQMYWVDFPHDAYAPEFVNEHPGIVIRAANSLHDTCIILPVTSAEQKAGTHFHKLSSNPNPVGQAQGIVAYVVCDHIYTVHNNRLRPIIGRRGQLVYPKIEQKDMEAIFAILKNVLSAAFTPPPAMAPKPSAPVKPFDPKTLTLPRK